MQIKVGTPCASLNGSGAISGSPRTSSGLRRQERKADMPLTTDDRSYMSDIGERHSQPVLREIAGPRP